MANRTAGGLPPSNFPAILDRLLTELADLRREVRTLQAAGGRTLPDDYRFENGAGGTLVIRCVSTDEIVATFPTG